MAVRTALAGLQTPDTVAGSNFANSMPGGWIGYVEKTSIQGPGFTSETTITWDSGSSVAVTVGPSRRIVVEAFIIVGGNVVGDLWAVLLKEGGTTLQTDRQVNEIANSSTSQLTFQPKVILTPSAGSHTYSVSMLQSSGTGNATVRGAAGQPNWLMVQDIGPA